MKEHTSISFNKQIVFIYMIVVIPFLLFMAFYNLYTISSTVDNQISKINNTNLKLFSSIVEKNLENIDRYMASIIANDSDYVVLKYDVGKLNAHISAQNIMQKAKSFLAAQKYATGFFLYSEKNELFRQIYNDQTPQKQRKDISQEIYQLISNKQENIQTWFYYMFNGEYYLIRMMEQGQAYIICALNLEEIINDSYKTNFDLTEAYIFTDDNLNPLTLTKELSDAGIDLTDYRDKGNYYTTAGGPSYVFVKNHLNGTNVSFLYLCEYKSWLAKLYPSAIWVSLLSLLCIALLPVCYMMMRHNFFTPITHLMQTMKNINSGNICARVNVETKIKEFGEMQQIFNSMVDQIQSLKIKSYEQTLQLQQTRLEYLHIQIRPHFYLNCLKNLYGMAQSQAYQEIQEMILVLSDYLRNMLQDSPTFTPIRCELHNVETYIKLQSMTGAFKIRLDILCEDFLQDFLIPPLCLLTFVENSVQHGMIPQDELKINIKVRLLQDEKESYVNISVRDNGKGFPDDMLDSLNSSDIHDISPKHIGLINIKQRISLIYSDKCSLSFYNSNGACIEIFLPYNQ